MTFDHHRPTSPDGSDVLPNLVYSCFRCNLYKGSLWPTEGEQLAGRRVLHPRFGNPEHYSEYPLTRFRVPLTDTGRFHLDALRLNRVQLVGYRLHQQAARLAAREHNILASLVADYRRLIHVENTVRDDLAASRVSLKRAKKRSRE